MSVEEIFNFVRINEQIITGGQPTAEQFKAAGDDGIGTVINLAPSDAANNALPEEPELLAGLGMDYIHIPIDWDAPKPEHFTAFCSAMEEVGNKKVLVHCAANYRVSAMVSCYGMSHLGWSEAEADALVSKIWSSVPEYSMNDIWQTFIDEARRAGP